MAQDDFLRGWRDCLLQQGLDPAFYPAPDEATPAFHKDGNNDLRIEALELLPENLSGDQWRSAALVVAIIRLGDVIDEQLGEIYQMLRRLIEVTEGN